MSILIMLLLATLLTHIKILGNEQSVINVQGCSLKGKCELKENVETKICRHPRDIVAELSKRQPSHLICSKKAYLYHEHKSSNFGGFKSLCHVEWHHKLDEYRRKRPNLRVVDKLQSVMQLSNRINMLAPMKEDIVLMVKI